MRQCGVSVGIKIASFDGHFFVRLDTMSLKTMALRGFVIELADIKQTAVG